MPRTLIHDHDHGADEHAEHHHDHTSGDEEADADCFTCDFDLSVFNVGEIQSFRFQDSRIFIPVANTIQRLSDECFDYFQHRGPPAQA